MTGETKQTVADLEREERHEERKGRFKWGPHVIEIAAKMSAAGAIDPEIAEACGVASRTFEKWKAKYPELAAVCVVGKRVPDERVKASLYKRATGFTYIEHKVFYNQKTGEVVKVPVEVVVPPETLAQIFWLKNRRPDEFRDVKGVEHSGVVRQVHSTKDMSDDDIGRELERIGAALKERRATSGAPAPESGEEDATSVH